MRAHHRSSTSHWAFWAVAAAVALSLFAAQRAVARPLYFDNFVALYGFTPGDDLYSCGVCHRNWEGTGARNPYGFAVEQQLYIGQPITSAIIAVEAMDTDLDGYTNLEELTIYGTLPAYSCDNFDLAINPPPNFQSLITPGVPSCLEPMDLRVTPLTVAFVTQAGKQSSVDVDLINNGTDEPIAVTSVEILPGADPSLGLSGPVAPLNIPVGARETFTLTFAPDTSLVFGATLRITSDDPDQPIIDVAISALGVVLPLAPAATRAACLKVVDRQVQGYAKTGLREWERCFLDEVRGRACDAGRRVQKLQQSAASLRSRIGGAKDVACAGSSLSPGLLGVSNTCGGGCSGVAVTNIGAFAECLVCRTDEAAEMALESSFGVRPPDLPGMGVTKQSASCQKKIIKGMRKAAGKIHRLLARCEYDNLLAQTPVDCEVATADKVLAERTRLDAIAAGCVDTIGLFACPFDGVSSPTCLGDTALLVGSGLAAVSFGTGD